MYVFLVQHCFALKVRGLYCRLKIGPLPFYWYGDRVDND